MQYGNWPTVRYGTPKDLIGFLSRLVYKAWPNIAISVKHFLCVMNDSMEELRKNCKCILQQLKWAARLNILYQRKNCESRNVAYFNSPWAQKLYSRNSISVEVLKLVGRRVSWGSKQHIFLGPNHHDDWGCWTFALCGKDVLWMIMLFVLQNRFVDSSALNVLLDITVFEDKQICVEKAELTVSHVWTSKSHRRHKPADRRPSSEWNRIDLLYWEGEYGGWWDD